MNTFLRSLPQHHQSTNDKIPAANKALKKHPEYRKIEGVIFVHGTINPITKETSLNYATPDNFSEGQLELADKIVQELSL
jgi:hypothetical protein